MVVVSLMLGKKSKIIVAYDENRGIGLNNDLPWNRNQADMQHFSKVTTGHTVIMGRNTWNSIPIQHRPLKGRTNVVVSRTINDLPNAFVCRSLEEAVRKSGNYSFIIGGAQIYQESIEKDLVDLVIASEMHGTYKADVFFSKLPNGWELDSYSNQDCFKIAYYRKMV